MAFACFDPDCSSHYSLLEEYCNSLCTSLKSAASQTLPHTRSSRPVPGWNDSARLLKSKANFWHKVWIEAGRPSSGVLFQIKKRTRSKLKFEVRKLKRREKYIRRSKLAAALSSKNSRKFWSEVKRINSRKSPPSVPTVDSVHGASNIAQLFSSNLESLLNSNPSAPRDDLLSSLLIHSDDLSSFSFSEDCVCEALGRLKPGKADGSSLSSDYFIKAAALQSWVPCWLLCSLHLFDMLICLPLSGTAVSSQSLKPTKILRNLITTARSPLPQVLAKF